MSTQEFEKKYHLYKDLLYRISFTYAKNQADAEDLLQEVFVKLLYQAPAFESTEHEKRWLIRVTVNLAKNFVKSTWSRQKDSLESHELEIPWTMDLEKQELLHEVLQLPDKCKAVVYLHYYEGYTCKEISKMLGLTLSAVKMRLKKGRSLLKMNLSEGGTFYETGRI